MGFLNLAGPMNKGSGFQQGLSFGLRMGVEMLVATLVGALIGYGLDYLLGTKPWLLAVFIMFGGAAGTLNVYRAAMAAQQEESEEQEEKPETKIQTDVNEQPQTSNSQPRPDRKL